MESRNDLNGQERRPFTTLEFEAIHNKILELKNDGRECSASTEQRNNGFVSLTVGDWKRNDGSSIIIEINKYELCEGFGEWAIELFIFKPRKNEPQGIETIFNSPFAKTVQDGLNQAIDVIERGDTKDL